MRCFFGIGLRGMLGATLVVTACSGTDDPSQTKSRALNQEERLADFDALVGSIKSYYGPLEYKERRFGYRFADKVSEARGHVAQAGSDGEFSEALRRFLTNFRDGHVKMVPPNGFLPTKQYAVPLTLYACDGGFMVHAVGDSIATVGFDVGDQVVAVDGEPIAALRQRILQLANLDSPHSNEHLAASFITWRPTWIPSLLPTGARAQITLMRADGSTYERYLTWRASEAFPSARTRSPVAAAFTAAAPLAPRLAVDLTVDLSEFQNRHDAVTRMDMMGATRPIFATQTVLERWNMAEVKPSATMLARYGVDPAAAPEIFAALYEHDGKRFLLVRQPKYGISDEQVDTYIGTYQALFDEFDSLVDGLILDQTHNPGGSAWYVSRFFELFARNEASGMVQAMNPDRRWIDVYRAAAVELDPTLENEEARTYWWTSRMIEDAYDHGHEVSAPLSFWGRPTVQPDSRYTWTKPVTLLIDELDGSGGDVFPMLMKSAGRAAIWGRQTMGAGGNTENVLTLANSRININLTRGLIATYRPDGAYTEADYLENHGVTPHQEYTPRCQDIAAGFPEYVDSFSNFAVQHLP